MSLLDILTGGKTSEASSDLSQALQDVQAVQTPTQAELTLPQLQQYVDAGLMTAAQAQAVAQGSNAYNDVTNDASTTEAEKTALNQLQQVAGDNGMTPQMQAQLTAALNTANTNTQGERASIMDQAAQKGIPTSLMAQAQQQGAAGQDAQTANLASAQSAGQAEQNALTAMANAGNLAGNINTQEYTQSANKAAAQNAINLWNAQNQTNVNLANTANTQAANLYNTENAQNVSNENTQNANARTQYNAQVPETVFSNQMQKAGAEAGVSENAANTATSQGQQQAGIISGVIGGASQVGASALSPTPVYAAEGGNVPGMPEVSGDSRRNDKVHALLSPGEVVVPRSIAHNPDRVKQFVSHLLKQPKPIKPMHPDDLHGMMEALSRRREQAA